MYANDLACMINEANAPLFIQEQIQDSFWFDFYHYKDYRQFSSILWRGIH